MADPKRKLPEGITKKLRSLITELEEEESRIKDRSETGTIELKISEDEALWYVAYKTAAQ